MARTQEKQILFDQGLKECQRCKEILTFDNFKSYPHSGLLRSKCQKCLSEYGRERNKKMKLERNFIPKGPRHVKKVKQPITPESLRTCKYCKIEKNLMTGFYKKNTYYEHRCSDCTSKDKRKTYVRKPKKEKVEKVVKILKPIRKVLSNPNYVDNRLLHIELIISQAKGKLSPVASSMIILIAKNIIKKFRYSNLEDKEDCLSNAYLIIFKNWVSYNPDVTTNAFAYMSELCKRSIAAGWNQLTKRKGMKEGENYKHISMSGFGSDGEEFKLNI